jgi:Phosphotransferase enzyme family
VAEYRKQRGVPAPGTIPAALDMFRSEVRFYLEIAPAVGVRVPECHQAEVTGDGTLLILEDLSSWRPGADPVEAARVLAELHARWVGVAPLRWPWLRRIGAAVDLVESLYDRTWPALAARADLTPAVRSLAQKLIGNVTASEYAISRAGPLTLLHGDASLANMRTSSSAEIALLDWEDVSAAPGIADLAWLLISSVEPSRWAEVIAGYGTSAGLTDVLPAVVVQGLFELSGTPDQSSEGAAWLARLEAGCQYLATNS